MSARGAWQWIAAALVVALIAYHQDREARALKVDLGTLEEELALKRERVRVLAAEWHHLSRPGRIADLAERYLGEMRPMDVRQFSPIGDLPYRPPPFSAAPEASSGAMREGQAL